MKRNRLLLASLLLASAVGLFAAGCKDNQESSSSDSVVTGETKQVMLANFEQWGPDFQLLRLREEFGSIDVNKDATYVKSGKQSAQLTVMGWGKGNSPYFFIPTQSDYFGYDYSDFSKIDTISTWIYNASETEANMYMGLVTDITNITDVSLAKPETMVLKKGWNEIVYSPDMNYVISGVGIDKYEGIKGVYFMFDKSGVELKADAPKYYIDDIALNYGEEREYTPVRAGTYYNSGSYIGGANGMFFKNAIMLDQYEGKAMQLEFRFASEEGLFGFAVFGSDWANVTGRLYFEKKDGVVTASMGKIYELEDGWYRWLLNKEFFSGDGMHRATDVGLIYHEGIITEGQVEINWLNFVPVEAYTYTQEEVSDKYTDGDYAGGRDGRLLPKHIPMEDLEGKALHFEFKFVEDGSFGFTVFSREWANVTGRLTVTKTGDTVTASINSNGIISKVNRIVALEDGWYAWEMNAYDLLGDGLYRATEVALIYHENQVVSGEVYIDWSSFQAVDEYEYDEEVNKEEMSIRYTNGEKIGGAGGMLLPVPVQISQLEGKALSFEFKFESENGYFACTLCDSAREWANTIGLLKITKNGDTITANNGRIVALEDGWYMWKFNRSLFAGDGIARAQVVELIYNEGEAVQGDVFINWMSLKAVDAYEFSKEESATRYTTGEYVGGNNGTLLSDSVPVAYLEGKALRFEFKIEGDGSFGFTIFSREWKNMTGKITITKTGDTVTASINSNGVISDKSRIIELENGWYAWELNASDFIGDGLADAVDLGLIYHENQVVSGVVYIDWLSVNIIDAK